ncbi:hypothetical protein PTKIN_Ptkin10aG0188200 [Pterospermum kingtungense]
MAVFSKLLTNTDIKKRLAIPAKIMPSLPDFDGSHAVEIQLMYGTRMWPIVCTIRKKGYKKPVFSGGWRDFVVCNNLSVGDRLTLYKVQDEAGSFYYKVQVQKQAKPSEVDGTTGCSRTKPCDFENEQEQLVEADARPIKQEQAMMESADVAADWPVSFAEHFSPKLPIRIFGPNVSDEVTSKAHFKTEEESKMKFLGICCMGEASLHPYHMTNEEREIRFSGLAEDIAMPYATSQAHVGDETRIEGLSLDLILGQPSTPYVEVNLDLTLAPPIVD